MKIHLYFRFIIAFEIHNPNSLHINLSKNCTESYLSFL